MKNYRILIVASFACLGIVSSAWAQGCESFANLVEKLQPSVVNISTTNKNYIEPTPGTFNIGEPSLKISTSFSPTRSGKTALGSGFIIDKEGHILTNHHVIQNAKETWVILADGTQLEAKIIGSDVKTDAAILKVDTSIPLTPVVMGDSDAIRVGDWILAIGNPFGLGGSVTAGIVSAKSRDIDAGPYDNFIQTDASINQGSSGGPLFNMQGEVIGVNTAIFSTSGGNMGVSFATPINLLRFVIDELKTKGKVERGWLGIKIQAQSTDMASSVEQKVPTGVMISSISDKSQAKKAGLEAGDVIVKINGQEVSNPKIFSRIIAETKVGQVVSLDVWRDAKINKVELIIDKMPESNFTPKIIPPSPAEESAEKHILGMILEELSPELIDKYQLPTDANGVIVQNVKVGSDAELKGLKIGDLITQIDKKAIFGLSDVKAYIDEAKAENNRPVLLLINNNNIPHFAAVKLDDNE